MFISAPWTHPLLAKKFALAAAAVAMIALSTTAAATEQPPLKGVFADNFNPLTPPIPAPQAVFSDGAGQPVTLQDFHGQVVVLNFWATWCAPCVHEMPTLDNLQAKLGGPRLRVVAVSEDRGGAKVVEPFMARTGLKHLDVYIDRKGALFREFGAKGLPTTLLIDAEGRVVGGLEGPAEWDSDEALELIRFYMDRGAAAPLKTGG